MTELLSNLDVREIVGKYRMLLADFVVYSKIVGKIIIPKGFVCDYESVPIIRGTSKRAGVVHDYLYRCDAEPCADKSVADKVYREFMLLRGISSFRRFAKYNAVRFFGFGSYHKLCVGDTYESILEKKKAGKYIAPPADLDSMG